MKAKQYPIKFCLYEALFKLKEQVWPDREEKVKKLKENLRNAIDELSAIEIMEKAGFSEN